MTHTERAVGERDPEGAQGAAGLADAGGAGGPQGESGAQEVLGAAGATGGVELWLLDARAAEHAVNHTVLDAQERERAARFVREEDRVLYRVSHAALRAVLSARTGVPAADLRFEREPCPCCGALHGRPRLAAATGGPAFSLSHGGGLVLIGLVPDATPVGVDVEALPAPQAVRDTAAALHPAERAELAAAPDGPSPAAFARIWTRKEAYLKALGTGLGRDPAADYLGEDPARLPQGWTITNIPTATSHAAAFAVARPGVTYTLHRGLT